ncbi:MAG: hypothetical protein IIB16_11630 [Chloroflexi bacterium]|nr:hypothetical protein [Chloroflexota bacterium]
MSTDITEILNKFYTHKQAAETLGVTKKLCGSGYAAGSWKGIVFPERYSLKNRQSSASRDGVKPNEFWFSAPTFGSTRYYGAKPPLREGECPFGLSPMTISR